MEEIDKLEIRNEFQTRFEHKAWETFQRFTAALTSSGFADTIGTAKIAAMLTQSAMINSLDAEIGNVVDQLVERNRQL